jgi:hypothetical protein
MSFHGALQFMNHKTGQHLWPDGRAVTATATATTQRRRRIAARVVDEQERRIQGGILQLIRECILSVTCSLRIDQEVRDDRNHFIRHFSSGSDDALKVPVRIQKGTSPSTYDDAIVVASTVAIIMITTRKSNHGRHHPLSLDGDDRRYCAIV